MKILSCFCFYLCVALASSLHAYGAERYISDTLVVTLRDAPTRTSTIIGHLRSGDYMAVLEETENGYLRVRTPKGLEGWIPQKYTSSGKSKDIVIRNLKKSIVALNTEKNSIKNKNSTLTTQANDYQTVIDSNATTEAKQQAHILDIEKQFAEAQDRYITLKEQSEGIEALYLNQATLEKENISLTKEVVVLKRANRELDQTRNILWFLAGGCVLLVGFVLGRSGRKNRRNSLTM